MLPATFNELDDKHKYNLACAILRNTKDGNTWRKNFHNGYNLKKYLEKLDLDPNIFSRHYKLRFDLPTNKKQL